MIILIYLIGVIIWGVIWGCATNAVIRNKGYDENWFAWGFFFGFIALIVACAKPENSRRREDYAPMYPGASPRAQEAYERQTLENGGWKCVCGTVNSRAVWTCKCGRTKASAETEKNKMDTEKIAEEIEKRNIKTLTAYKELLDSGAITQEEFEAKKKQLLGL